MITLRQYDQKAAWFGFTSLSVRILSVDRAQLAHLLAMFDTTSDKPVGPYGDNEDLERAAGAELCRLALLAWGRN